MNWIISIASLFLAFHVLISQEPSASSPVPPNPGAMLPEKEYSASFFSDDKGQNFHKSFEGGVEKTVRLKTRYKFDDHCYVSCQSDDSEETAYRNRDGSYVHGMFSVRGNYLGGHCRPVGYQALDYSYLRQFIKLCKTEFPNCKKRCKAGSYTGFIFGSYTE